MDKMDKLAELKEGKSALKQFTTEYTIDGKAGYDAKSFLREAKPLVVDLMEKKLGNSTRPCLGCYAENHWC